LRGGAARGRGKAGQHQKGDADPVKNPASEYLHHLSGLLGVVVRIENASERLASPLQGILAQYIRG
jgi:hypothetical protein